MQTRKHSVAETITNLAVGYVAAVGSQLVIFPVFGISLPMRTNFALAIWFAAASVVRSYFVRRLFAQWEDEL